MSIETTAEEISVNLPEHSEQPVSTSESEPQSADTALEAAAAPLSLERRAYIFNQFYFDLLKKVKQHAKTQKEKMKEARDILRAIKNSYSSYETASVEYLQRFRELVSSAFWDAYKTAEIDAVDQFLLSETASSANVYHNMSVNMIAVVMKDAFILHHYLTIFAILLEEANEADLTKALECLKQFKQTEEPANLDAIANTTIRGHVTRLYTIYTHHMANLLGNQFSDIESTSLGKLAKEIMEEVDLSNLQNSLGEDGDIFKALTDPNSGITSLLGKVSQKMISKLASGEIKQENLLEDAMKFATKLPGLMPGGTSGNGSSSSGGGLDFGNMASMMQSMMGGMGGLGALANLAGGAAGDENSGAGLGLDALTNMMQNMMGSGGNRAKRSMANNPHAVAAQSAARSMVSNSRKTAQIQQIRKKLEKRKAKDSSE